MSALLPLLAAAALGSPLSAPEPADIAWVARGAFCEPETVLPLPDTTLLVSNVCDFRRAGTGFLSLLDARGRVLDWRIVDGLDAPLGMARNGDEVFVVDNNRVRVFAWPGLAPRRTLELDTAVANDIAVAADGTLYVSDYARASVLRIAPDGTRALVTGGPAFAGANGVALEGRHLWVGGARLWCVNLDTGAITTVGPPWLADIDGIEFERDGTLQVTPVGGPLVRRLGADRWQVLGGEGVSSANHGYSVASGLALIPTGFDNEVIAIRVPGR